MLHHGDNVTTDPAAATKKQLLTKADCKSIVPAAARTRPAAINSAFELNSPASDLALDRDGARVLDAAVGVRASEATGARLWQSADS
jgi:hypothetical protein